MRPLMIFVSNETVTVILYYIPLHLRRLEIWILLSLGISSL